MRALETRLPPPLLFALIAAAMWGLTFAAPAIAISDMLRLTIANTFAGASVILAATAILTFARAKTTIDPVHIEATSTLVTTGIYRITRNPMYLSLTSLLIAWAIYLALPEALIGPIAFAAYLSRFQIIPEERVLTEKFGIKYTTYTNQTRRWF
jgi:protein-S-isoprenylcysteine O-methyltransferase Ste14